MTSGNYSENFEKISKKDVRKVTSKVSGGGTDTSGKYRKDRKKKQKERYDDFSSWYS